MPGTMTRLRFVRSSAASLRLAGRNRRGGIRRAGGALSGRHVALVGADASPYVTGVDRFTRSLHDLLAERGARVSCPLVSPMDGVPELVISVLPGPGAAGAGVELADRHDAPLLLVVQGESRPVTEDAGTSGARLAARLENRALKRADCCAVTTDATRNRLLRLGVDRNRIDRLPYWADPVGTGLSAEAERAAARRSLGWPGGFLVVCPVGADTAGLMAVGAAAQELVVRGGSVQLMLVGRGPRLRALSVSAAGGPNVTVAELSDDEYPKALMAADLVVLTEASDRADGATAGRLAAAMAAGRPTIAAVAGGDTPELDRAGRAVLRIPADRPLYLAEAIDALRSAPSALAMMASDARQYTRTDLGPATAGAALDEIAARILSRQTGSWWGWAR